MGIKNNKICIICGKKYSYCPNCGQDANKPTWYFVFDGENCRDIYETCVSYRDKEITVEQAYERISKLDISDIKDFAKATRNQIEEILSNGKESKAVNEKPKANNTKVNKK